ncbi:hypothetical protein DSECCO2_593860 [anaerobic digester metagenome]
MQLPAAVVPGLGHGHLARAHGFQELVAVGPVVFDQGLGLDQLGLDLGEHLAVGLLVGVEGEGVVAHGEAETDQHGPLQPVADSSLVLRVDEGLPGRGALGLRTVHHQAGGAPAEGHGVGCAADQGVLLHGFEHGGDEEFGLDLGVVDRLVDAELLLHRGDAVLAGLGQVEARAARGAQLGDHLLVVGVGHLDLDAGLGLELVDEFLGRIALPGQQLQGVGHGRGRTDEHQRHQQNKTFHTNFSLEICDGEPKRALALATKTDKNVTKQRQVEHSVRDCRMITLPGAADPRNRAETRTAGREAA